MQRAKCILEVCHRQIEGVSARQQGVSRDASTERHRSMTSHSVIEGDVLAGLRMVPV